MNDIYVVYYWPDFEDSPEVICAVTSEVDAQELVFLSGKMLHTTTIFLAQPGIQPLIQEIIGTTMSTLLILATIKHIFLAKGFF